MYGQNWYIGYREAFVLRLGVDQPGLVFRVFIDDSNSYTFMLPDDEAIDL